MFRALRPLVGVVLVVAAILGTEGAAPSLAHGVMMVPAIENSYRLVSTRLQLPSPEDCYAGGYRCFSPAAMQNSYDLGPLYAKDDNGAGQTIAIFDALGSDTIASDLNTFDSEAGLPHMCGETGVTCTPGMPTFSIEEVQGSPPVMAPPPKSHGAGRPSDAGWAVETTLDVEWAHAIAPGANIMLVTTPTAETEGVQGFPDMINAEDYVIQHHLASVISQSFGATEESFNSTQSLLNERYAYQDAQAAGITVIASSGDGGTANIMKSPVKNPKVVPYPTVNWPASDPLVTAVGGTDLCTNAATGMGVDSADPPAECQSNPGQREIGWLFSGGGFSHVFAKPSFQDNLPAGSTQIGSTRGVPDVAYNADGNTGPLIYLSAVGIPAGWYTIGGTSCGSPQWAGLIAIADQINSGSLGYINPALYAIGANAARYANDFYDVTVGNNGSDAPTVPGYNASTGWDPVTGLGTPNAANLLPDLVNAVHGH
jgi:subtilase family serine protease